jgi:hypothetical protein
MNNDKKVGDVHSASASEDTSHGKKKAEVATQVTPSDNGGAGTTDSTINNNGAPSGAPEIPQVAGTPAEKQPRLTAADSFNPMSGGAEPGPAKAPEKSTKKPLLDLAKYRGASKPLEEDETATGIQTNIPVKKPGKKNFFRVHPDQSYRLYDIAVIEEGGGELYLIDPDVELPGDALQFVSRENLLVSITHRGKLFVWHFKNTDTSWLSSALRVARRAQDEWLRVKADFDSGGYIVFTAPEPLRSKKPIFPAMSPEEIFTLAFENRRITSVDDPVIRRARGLE